MSESSVITSSVVQEALERAKKIAVTPQPNPLKRSANEIQVEECCPAKRESVNVEDEGCSKDRSNAEIDATPPGSGESLLLGGSAETMSTEVTKIPESCVGLVIGHGGEQIHRIESMYKCHVRMSTKFGSDKDSLRDCVVSGAKADVRSAVSTIQEIISHADDRDGANRVDTGKEMHAKGPTITNEMMIPGNMCGILIGRGGANIRRIQDEAEVELSLIQISHQIGNYPKPLRITGDANGVRAAKSMIEDVLGSNEPVGLAFQSRRESYSQPRHDFMKTSRDTFREPHPDGEILIPRESVGLIIGKGGETVRRIASESGARVIFQNDDHPSMTHRLAVIKGNREEVTAATKLITDLMNTVERNDVCRIPVLFNKAGLVIGKGGECIKQIISESGAHVQLSRDAPPNAMQKVFVMKGTPEQIHHAQHLIRIRVGDIPVGTPLPQYNGVIGGQCGVGANVMNAFPQVLPAGTTDVAANQGVLAAQTAWAQQYYSQQMQVLAQQSAYGTLCQQQAPVDYTAQWATYYRSIGMIEQAVFLENQIEPNSQGIGQLYAQSASFNNQVHAPSVTQHAPDPRADASAVLQMDPNAVRQFSAQG